jgi:hypothetical protein
MIARSVTIVAPICNEWPAPFPVLLMLGWALIGTLTSITFPNEDEFTPGIQQMDVKYDFGQPDQSASIENPDGSQNDFFDESLGEE